MTKKTKVTQTKKNLALFDRLSSLVEMEAKQRELKAQIDEYKSELLFYMQRNKAMQLKTEDYTITRAQRITPQIVSFTRLKKSLDKAKIPYETVEAFAPFMSETFKQVIKEGKELDGLEAKETQYVSVRITK